MDVSRVKTSELIAIAGGLLLAVAIFLKWYEGAGNPNIDFGDGRGEGTYTAWEIHTIIRWLLLAAAATPIVLAYIIARDHQLSWPRGQVTSVVAIAAFGLTFYNGLIDNPGEPSGEIDLEYGWYVAIAGILLMLFGSVRRQSETEIKRKPPGAL